MFSDDPVFGTQRVFALEAIFAMAAGDARIDDDPIADLEVGDVGSDRLDMSGPVRAEDGGEVQLQRRDPGADEAVQMVQRGRVGSDQDLVRPDHRAGKIRDELEDLGPAVLRQDDGLQRTTYATAANGADLDKGRRPVSARCTLWPGAGARRLCDGRPGARSRRLCRSRQWQGPSSDPSPASRPRPVSFRGLARRSRPCRSGAYPSRRTAGSSRGPGPRRRRSPWATRRSGRSPRSSRLRWVLLREEEILQ